MDDFVELLLLVLCKEAYHMDQRMATIKHEWLQYSDFGCNIDSWF